MSKTEQRRKTSSNTSSGALSRLPTMPMDDGAAEAPGPHVTGAYRSDLAQRGVKWPGLPYKGMMRSSNN